MSSINYNISDLEKIIRKGEDSRTQFKSRFDSIDSLAAEICSMANTEGGIIIIGISDDAEVPGVEDLSGLNQWISNACSQKIDPPLSVITKNIQYKHKLLVLIEVPMGINKPYAANKSDYWIKVGADKRRASREELKRLMQASGDLYADEMQVANTSLSDIDMFLFKRFHEQEYGMKIDEGALPIEQMLANLKLMMGNSLTLAGLLLFGERPERVKPQFVVRAVSFMGNDIGGSEYLDSEDIVGPLQSVFRDCMAFLKRNLRKKQKGQSFNLTGLIEIPEIAMEEAIVNALVHRDYFVNSSIRTLIFDNRIEIISPGKLPNNVTTDNIKLGIQMVRNPILLSFVSKLKIPYRGIGSGIIRMIRECKKAGIPEPEFLEDKKTEQFKVIFSRE